MTGANCEAPEAEEKMTPNMKFWHSLGCLISESNYEKLPGQISGEFRISGGGGWGFPRLHA